MWPPSSWPQWPYEIFGPIPQPSKKHNFERCSILKRKRIYMGSSEYLIGQKTIELIIDMYNHGISSIDISHWIFIPQHTILEVITSCPYMNSSDLPRQNYSYTHIDACSTSEKTYI